MNATQKDRPRTIDVLATRYDDVRELARGKNGTIFAGNKRGADRKRVAIKVAHAAKAEGTLADSVIRFRRECEIGAALHHPRILRIAPAEEAGGITFFETDIAGGFRLDHIALSQNKPPTFARIMAIMRELASALDYAHGQGIVHGTLRPSKVLFDETGHVLVKGFMLRENEATLHPALAPAAVGDAAYMAPEQWHASRATRRMDVYSAGILAYELCTGECRVGYDEAGVPEIRPIELAPNRPLRDGIPTHVTAAIRRATSKEPAIRFASVGEFAAALNHPDIARGHSLPTGVPTVPPKRTSRWMLVLLVMVFAVMAFFAVPSSPRHQVVEWGTWLLTGRD